MKRLTSCLRLVGVAVCLSVCLVLHAVADEDLHELIAEVTMQIEREPKNASLYLKRGELHRLLRDWRAALGDYRRAEQLDSSLDEVKFAIGRMYSEAGDHEQARIWLDRFLAAQPDHVVALVTRARVSRKLGQHLSAASDYSRSIGLSSTPNPDWYIERAQAQVAGGGKYKVEALGGIDEGIKKLGSIVTLELFAIDLELANRNYDAALTRIERIAAQSPRKEVWLARRGEVLRKAGRTDEAREAFMAALKAIDSLPPHNRETKATLELKERVRALCEIR